MFNIKNSKIDKKSRKSRENIFFSFHIYFLNFLKQKCSSKSIQDYTYITFHILNVHSPSQIIETRSVKSLLLRNRRMDFIKSLIIN